MPNNRKLITKKPATTKPATVPAKPASTKPATVATKPATTPSKPVDTFGAAAAAQAARGTSNVAGKPGKQPAAGTAPVAKPPAGIVRTARTIVAQATNFGALTDRDECYFRFYAGFCRANGGKPVTLGTIVASGRKPDYSGSAKPHDAGAINRLCKAGLLAFSGSGSELTIGLTANGAKHKA